MTRLWWFLSWPFRLVWWWACFWAVLVMAFAVWDADMISWWINEAADDLFEVP